MASILTEARFDGYATSLVTGAINPFFLIPSTINGISDNYVIDIDVMIISSYGSGSGDQLFTARFVGGKTNGTPTLRHNGTPGSGFGTSGLITSIFQAITNPSTNWNLSFSHGNGPLVHKGIAKVTLFSYDN